MNLTALDLLMPLLITIACAIGITFYVRRRIIQALPPAWKRVLESMRDGVIILDKQGHIADLNPAAQKIFGRDVKQLIGQDATQVLPDWGDVLQTPPNEEADRDQRDGYPGRRAFGNTMSCYRPCILTVMPNPAR